MEVCIKSKGELGNGCCVTAGWGPGSPAEPRGCKNGRKREA